jgi:chromosome segregation ATPase
MANEKNRINELVSDDEDPTAELEAVTFRQDHPSLARLYESDDATFDVEERRSGDAQTISKLRYDIEQLRAKWLGREAEIRAREEITDTLNANLASTRESLARKEKLLKTRDRTIKSLKSEIRDRDEKYRGDITALETQLDEFRARTREIPGQPYESPASRQTTARDERLARTEEYADLLRRKLQDLLAHHDEADKERRRADAALQRGAEREAALQAQVEELGQANEDFRDQLASLAKRHAEEIRMLRFELGEAQETMAQTEELNSQLASDLVDTRGFKEELERMLCDSDEQSRARIDQLEVALEKATQEARDREEKLEARSEAINVLLSELARKSEQMESIGEIGDVISDIDGRISEQFEEADEPPLLLKRPQERMTRVLVGRIGDKLLRFPLFKDRLTIGRTADNDIQLNAPYISRRHAVVTTDGETTRVIDWGSKNGVHVNSKRVTEHFLMNGDIVTIGNAHFRYEERRKREG